ncbi:MAG: 16S rRNA (cytosine(967)-C(5))-methyltransferase RsmB [Granulosicoccus sp.]
MTAVKNKSDVRVAAVKLLLQLEQHGGSLTRLLPAAQTSIKERDRPLLQALVYGCIRWSRELAGITTQLLDKPLKRKDRDIALLMHIGLFQLIHTRTAVHAAVDETVKVTRSLGKPWARGLVNAVLRNYQRDATALQAKLSEAERVSHPDWLLSILQSDWPDDWRCVVEANNRQAPMTLRINRLRGSVEDYASRLREAGITAKRHKYAEDALQLDSPVPITRLPGFSDGHVSVQDAAAQLTMTYLSKDMLVGGGNGGRMLDACAAPGGKAAHALEQGWFTFVLALDHDGTRLEQVSDTLARLDLTERAELLMADAADTKAWWDGVPFEAVLLDAPCSGTGVIRRHPDIKLLRRQSDIAALVATQARLLDALWPTVAVGGILLYATCSVLKDENERQIGDFLTRTGDARPLPFTAAWGREVTVATPVSGASDGQRVTIGNQLLPGMSDMDGFFYAPLVKLA